MYRCDRQDGCGGVAIFIRHDLAVSEIFLERVEKIDILCLDIALSKTNRIRLVAVYNPPKASVDLTRSLTRVIESAVDVDYTLFRQWLSTGGFSL